MRIRTRISAALTAAVLACSLLSLSALAEESASRWGEAQPIDQGPTTQGITYAITYQSNKDKQTYTQEQVDAMTTQDIKALKLFLSVVTYTIPEDFKGSQITLAMSEAVSDAMDYTVYMPGDAAPCRVEIVNRSGHSYSYEDGSFFVSTEHYAGLDWPELSDVVGFDGQAIPLQYFSLRPSNAAIRDLYEVKSIGSGNFADYLPDEKLSAQLTLKGYDSLAAYYLAYINAKYETDHAALEDFTDRQISSILGGTVVSYELYESDPEIQALSYNYFYNHLFSVTPADMGAPSTDEYSVGTLMRNVNAGIAAAPAFESGLETAFGAIAAHSEEGQNTYLWDGFQLQYNFMDLSNPYQGYAYGIATGLSLKRTDKDPEPPVDPPVYPDYSYYRVTVKYLEEGSDKVLHDNYRTASIREGRPYDVSAQAALAIDGYNLVRVDGAVSGSLNRNLTITVYYTPDTGDTEIPDPVPPTTDQPDSTDPEVELPDTAPPLADLPEAPSTPDEAETAILPESPPLGDLPQTGTITGNNALFLATASLSAALAAGLLVLTLSTAKKKEH